MSIMRCTPMAPSGGSSSKLGYTASGYKLRFFKMVGCTLRTNSSGAHMHPTTIPAHLKNAKNACGQKSSEGKDYTIGDATVVHFLFKA